MNNSSATYCGINFSADQVFLPVLYGVVFCIGLPTNCLALYGLYRLVKADYALPIYVINLLLADLLQIATLPLWIDYYSRQHVWHYGFLACKVAGSIFFISLYASVLFMCCIALERYLAIVHPLWYQRRRRLHNVYLLCLAAWAILVPPVVFSFHIGSKNENQTFCRESYPSRKEFAAYRLVTIPITFLLPLFFLAFIY
ncbi:G-protein coupled receptor 4-like [Amia ocellicauda]|uniref:G-protein coupled receptor 4-like n=1 Tax=Amia ocellicauda TaxID=2972642 RepID=UPI003463C867